MLGLCYIRVRPVSPLAAAAVPFEFDLPQFSPAVRVRVRVRLRVRVSVSVTQHGWGFEH